MQRGGENQERKQNPSIHQYSVLSGIVPGWKNAAAYVHMWTEFKIIIIITTQDQAVITSDLSLFQYRIYFCTGKGTFIILRDDYTPTHNTHTHTRLPSHMCVETSCDEPALPSMWTSNNTETWACHSYAGFCITCLWWFFSPALHCLPPCREKVTLEAGLQFCPVLCCLSFL